MSKDLIYDMATFGKIRGDDLELCINMDTIGVLPLRTKFGGKVPIVIDLQDANIQDDGTLPVYDQIMISKSDLVIFASRAIKHIAEKQHPKILKRAVYIPFGIDLALFDQYYRNADPRLFIERYALHDRCILTFTGAAYFWGRREGQGIEKLLKSFRKVTEAVEQAILVLQGVATPKTYMWEWLKVKIKQYGVESKTLLLPSTPPHDLERMSLLKASELLLLPIGDVLLTYYAEQQKLFEYMAAQRPIAMVATPARLHVLDEKSAFIARRRDPDEFAYTITEALNNPEEAAMRAARARKIVEERYDWKTLVHEYAAAVASTLGA
ncbi:MAG: glycosyltransferase [Candidatus Caldarchaeum sp.]